MPSGSEFSPFDINIAEHCLTQYVIRGHSAEIQKNTVNIFDCPMNKIIIINSADQSVNAGSVSTG